MNEADLVKVSKKTIDYVALLTAIALLSYIGLSGFSLISEKIDFESFAANVGPLIGMLVGFWVKK